MIREIRRFRSSSRPVLRRLAASLLCAVMVGLVATLPATQAQASPDTLRRGFSNIIGGPLDMVLSPITGILTLAKNIADVDDSTGVRLVYALPGWVWLTGVNFGSGGIRFFTGTLELVPGVLLFPFETDIDTLFDPVDDASALIDIENPITWIENPWVYWNPLVVPFAIHPKWGIDYTRAEL